MIKTIKYNLTENIILTSEILNSYISQFFNEVFSPIIEVNPKHLMIICKVKYGQDSDSGYKTLAPLRRVEFGDKELFSDYLCERLGILIDSYSPQNISEIIFTYIIKDGVVSDSDRLLLEDLTNKELPFHNFNKINLPISMNPSDYGDIRSKTEIDGIIRYIVESNKRSFEIDISLDGLTNKVRILGASKFEWIDIKISDDYFKREIGKSTLYFLDGELILQKAQLNAKPFRAKSVEKDIIKYFRHNGYRNN